MTTTNDATLLLRLPASLKEQLMRSAAINGRRITAEINIRLESSLKDPMPPSYSAPRSPARLATKEESPADLLSETDRAMLAVFRRMPVDKQLALLSLFR